MFRIFEYLLQAFVLSLVFNLILFHRRRLLICGIGTFIHYIHMYSLLECRNNILLKEFIQKLKKWMSTKLKRKDTQSYWILMRCFNPATWALLLKHITYWMLYYYEHLLSYSSKYTCNLLQMNLLYDGKFDMDSA